MAKFTVTRMAISWILNYFCLFCQFSLSSGTNYAVHQPVYCDSGDCTPAVDGNPDPNHRHSSCHQSVSDSNSWVVVKLNVDDCKTLYVTSVAVQVRTDCCTEKNKDYQFRVGMEFAPANFDPMNYDLCFEKPGQLPNYLHTYTCPAPMKARYLVINAPTTMLQICEIFVYGDVTDEDPRMNGGFVFHGNVSPTTVTGDSFVVSSMRECAKECTTNCLCRSFTVERMDTKKYMCEISNFQHMDLQNSATKKYYTRKG